MKIAYFDTIAGVSGDMTLGAFLGAGVRLDDLRGEIAKLNLPGVEIEASRLTRNGITAVKVDVVISAPSKKHRHLREILELIQESALFERVKLNASRIFQEVARAEAAVHGIDVDAVHFHEVGALDSIVDIVGAAVCIDLLGIGSVYSSPVKLGLGGYAETEHGRLPVPAPATLEILKNYPVVLTEIPHELTTPTGAAIIKALSSGVLSSEALRVDSIGYGAGTRELTEVPNLLRIMVGERTVSNEHDEVCVVETTIDDMNPEIYPYVIERLVAVGALDAFLSPTVMKKGRPGMLLTILADRSRLESVLAELFSQTTTIGARISTAGRRKVDRREVHKETALGHVRAKLIIYNNIERIVPEFEECKRLAIQHGIPLLEVYRILEGEWRG